MRAAVCTAIGNDTVEIFNDVSAGVLQAGEVRLRMQAAGICASDVSAMNGNLPQMAPVIPGHEGAGDIIEVAPDVTSCHVGDHVIVAWNPPCGTCPACLRGETNLCVDVFFNIAGIKRYHRADGTGLYGFAGTGTWIEESVLPAQGVIVIDDDVPYEIGALIGCGVTTGIGAAINTAQVRPGSSVVVFGCGGVGISTIQGAKLAGAAEIVAVDTVPSKQLDALRFGATHGVHPDDLAELQRSITGGEGFDYAFECVGVAPTFRAAWDATRRGGTTVIVGAGSEQATLVLNGFELFFDEKKLLGSFYGSADVRTEFHRLIRLWKSGRIDLESMISDRIPLEDINRGLEALKQGEIIRQIVTF